MVVDSPVTEELYVVRLLLRIKVILKEEGDELISLEEAMPSGYEISPPPLEEQLMFRGERAVELVGRRLLFNWAAVGWLEGEITAANTDARRRIKVGPPPHLPLSPLAEMLSPCWVII